MKKSLISVFAAALLVGCSNTNSGELVGVDTEVWKEPNPYGMVYIKNGSFTMGANDQDANWASNGQSKVVSVDAFWMDETEITNSEYRQFVNWVRDSIVMEKLVAAEGDESEFAVHNKKSGDVFYKSGNRPNDKNNESIKKQPSLNWNAKIPWSKPTEDQEMIIDSMFYSDEESLGYTKELNGQLLNYQYRWIDYNQAALKRNRFNSNKGMYETDLSQLEKGKDSAAVLVKKDTSYIDEYGHIINTTKFVQLTSRKDFISSRIINIYPDTLCWIRDFSFAYNEPYMKLYFCHSGYSQYPVVGVTWEQASAFAHWRSKYYNIAQIAAGQHIVQDYRLPTETEWEYAARGGRNISMYPWGGEYIRTARGCYLANFKPMHGNYVADGWMATAKVGSFPPNDYGLYDMAGNVAEWTSSAFHESTYSFLNDMNPSYNYYAHADDPDVMKRKVIRGGSWKDIGYYLQCGARTYEYQTESRSFIGFRCVRSVIGANYQN